MIIPKTIKFSAHGTAWTVALRSDRRVSYNGMCYLDAQRIDVCAINKHGARIPPLQWQTFWHELLHAALHDMGHPLRDNEHFVDSLGERLAYATRTAVLP